MRRSDTSLATVGVCQLFDYKGGSTAVACAGQPQRTCYTKIDIGGVAGWLPNYLCSEPGSIIAPRTDPKCQREGVAAMLPNSRACSSRCVPSGSAD